MKRLLRKLDSIRVLKLAGLQIASVIDIGVQDDTWELRNAYPNVPHVLFEPVVEYHDAIRKNYAGMDYKLIETALSDRFGPLLFKEVRADKAGQVSHVRPAFSDEEGLRPVTAVRLDQYLQQNPLPKPYLIKIDVDGHESEIMRGAKLSLKDAACVIVESTMPHITERCMLAEKAGLVLWDMVDFSYYRGSLYQVDLIFLAQSAIVPGSMLDPFLSMALEFHPDEWFSRDD